MTVQDLYNEFVNQGLSPADAVIMTAIDGAESSYNSTALNSNGEYSVGLGQINLDANAGIVSQLSGIPATDIQGLANWLMDPINNVKAQIAILKSQGFGAWTTYTNGSYLKYGNSLENYASYTITNTPSTSTSSTSSTTPTKQQFDQSNANFLNNETKSFFVFNAPDIPTTIANIWNNFIGFFTGLFQRGGEIVLGALLLILGVMILYNYVKPSSIIKNIK